MSIFSHCCGNSNTRAKRKGKKRRRERIENSILRHNQFGCVCPFDLGI